MKIMVICAGVIGSHFCHVFCENGHEVTVVARGARKGELEKKGLVLRHYLQYKGTVDYVQDAVGTSGGKRLLQKCSGA